jgi:hypothetical protein
MHIRLAMDALSATDSIRERSQTADPIGRGMAGDNYLGRSVDDN